MDLASDSLSLSSIEMLRQADGLDHRQRDFIPSKGQKQNEQSMLSKHDDRILPCTIEETGAGECVNFCME